MKHKCSFIFKASTSLLLALIMLFGTVATSIAAVVDNADTGAESANLADTGTNGAVVSDGSNVFLYIKTDAGQDGWNNAGAITGVEFSTGGDSNAGTTQRVDAHTDVTISGTSYWRYAVPSGTWYYVKPYRINPTGYDSSKNDNNVWTWANHRIALHTDDNRINKLWETGSEFTWGDDIIEYPPVVSITAPLNYLAADNTSTVTLSSTYTNSSYINGTKTWSTTTGSSVGSSTGVFKASKSGTYTVTCTLSYNVKGYSGITGSATKTYDMHAGYPAGKRLLVNPSGGALTATPNWGVHLFNDNTGAVYYANVSECSTGSGYYYIDIPAMTSLSTCYTHMQWLRVANGQTVNGLTSWDNDKIWNNSGNIVYDSGSSYNCFEYNAADKSSSTTNTKTHTHKLYAYTYRRENPTTAYSLHATLKNNYDVECGTTSVSVTSSSSGYTFDGWKRNSSVSTSGQGTATTAVSSEETASLNTQAVESYYYANYTHYNTQISFTQTGGTGTIQIGGTTGTSKYVSTGASTALSITPPTGYSISSVTCTSGTEPTWTTSTATSYVGTVTPTANTSITVTYSEIKPDVALNVYSNGTLGVDGGKVSINGVQSNLAENTINPGISSHVTALHSAPASGYTFTGWTVEGEEAEHIQLYTSTTFTDANKYTPGGTDTTIYIKTDGASGLNTSNAIIKAHFQKVHYITVYNTTMYDRAHWAVLSSPPQQVKVYGANGVNKTYKYAYGDVGQRGEDNVSTTNDPATAVKNIVNTNNATYYEGNLLEVHEGDRVELIYSALASSDIITGVFYNNSIRYTTELEDDNLFCLRNYSAGGYGDRPTTEGETRTYHDLTGGAAVPDDDVDFFYDSNYTGTNTMEGGTATYDGHALYANQYYYNSEIALIISSATYAATVDQDDHIVSWTIGPRDYLNVDLELASKKEIHFSDTVNAVINEVHTDNYYSVGETISPSTAANTSLSIMAAGNSAQTNTITKANIKFYYCNNLGEYINPATGRKVSKDKRVELTGDDAILSVEGDAASISNSGTTASTDFYYIRGTMPATDVMVDLDLTVTYTLKLYSKVQSDTNSPAKTAFYQVADLTLGTKYDKDTDASTSTLVGTSTCDDGQSISLKAENITSGYMFIAWYIGTDSAPDFSKAPISTSAVFNYKPTSSVTIWAVGTRDLYIAGSKELFEGDTEDYVKHHQMKFDPTLGTGGVYYFEITEKAFAAASRVYSTTTSYSQSTGEGGDSHWYWSSAYSGNAQFQFRDLPDDNGNTRTVWSSLTSFKTVQDHVEFGKIYFAADDYDTKQYDGIGFINFKESDYDGYSTPLTIYYDPNATGAISNKLYVKSTPIYPHIYLSNGYKGRDVGGRTGTPSDVTISVNGGTARSNSTTNDSSYTANLKFNGAGWDPWYEGHVSDITVSARNATLTLTKTTVSADYKVSNFLVYNMTKGTVKAYPATATANANEYSCNTIKTSDDDRMYIVPIIEYCGSNAKITVLVDSTQLDYKKWGKLISCYAWGSDGDYYGAYPGQLMVPSDDGGSWKATFEAPSTLTGILFANYVDSGNAGVTNGTSKGYTFISMSGIMGSVTYGGSGTQADPRTVTIGDSDKIKQYNYIASGDYKAYDRANCKVQTYDYREPIAYYNNKPDGATSTTLTFSLKDGNSNLLSRSHSELMDTNILTLKKISDGTQRTWSALRWEYLTDSTGDYYADLNGYKLPDKPTASFYIAAKGMVIYSDNAMTTVFKTGKDKDTGITGVEYKDYEGYSAGEIDLKYAVQWYIYDASGNYITNVLSAGFADLHEDDNTMSVITKRLLNLGYAVEGRSVKICYDKPRYCYQNSSGINDGNDFDVYRFTGQWYQDNEYKTAKVYAKVGLKTDNGDDVLEASSATFGSASVRLNTSVITVPGHAGISSDDDVDYAFTTVIDGDKGAITLTASEDNFIGWYHYTITGIDDDGNTETELVFDTKDPLFTPNYSKDATYIAMYEAKAIYSYVYAGRENTTRAYNVSTNVHLTDAEIAAGNKVAVGSVHLSGDNGVIAKSPGAGAISRFKKTVTVNTPTAEMLSNPTEYVLTIANITIEDEEFNLTVKYRDANGELADYNVNKVTYGTMVDLLTQNSGNYLTNLWSGHQFIGWYDYTDNKVGELLSTQVNYGMAMVKTQTIVAVYTDDGNNITASTDTDWHVYIDDNLATYEKTSASAGIVYNDAIIRVRKNNTYFNTVTLDPNARVGMIIVEDGGSDQVINTGKLSVYANALKASSGKTGTVSVNGKSLKVTNLFTTEVNNFGRADLAAKYSFASVTGHKYYIYAYYFDGTNYHFDTTNAYATGTYN